MEKLETLIAPERLKEVETALLETFNTAVPEEITLLQGGLSAAPVYKLIVNGLPYILKLSDAMVEPDLPTCMAIAAAGGIAPPVQYVNHGAGITITSFIASMPLHGAFTSAETLLPQLAKTIRSVHELPLFSKESNMVVTVDGLIHQFKASGMLQGPAYNECFEKYGLIRNHYPWEHPDKVSSHNDLNPNNMIFDGQKIWVIDWDAAFKNDRYADLAIIANFYVSNDDHELIFLENYFGVRPSAVQQARFFIMRQICRLVYAMLMFRLAENNKPEGVVHNADLTGITLAGVKGSLGSGALSLSTYEGQLLFGKALLAEALNSMRSGRFSTSLDLCATDILQS